MSRRSNRRDTGDTRREPPLVNALQDPETLLDRFVLGLLLGPPRARDRRVGALGRLARPRVPTRRGPIDDG